MPLLQPLCCRLCGEKAAVYGFAEVVTPRDGTSDTLPNEKGGSSERQKRQAMVGGRGVGGGKAVFPLSETIGRSVKDAAGCLDASLRALHGKHAWECPVRKKCRVTLMSHHPGARIAAVSVLQFLCGLFCDLCCCHLLRVRLCPCLSLHTVYGNLSGASLLAFSWTSAWGRK